MHELSIVMSIVDIATKQASQAQAHEVEQIELEIGQLSGVEMQSFDFAWKQGIKNSVLQKAELVVNRPEGIGECLECHTSFHLDNLFDSCLVCGSHFIDIKKGKELRVKSLVVN